MNNRNWAPILLLVGALSGCAGGTSAIVDTIRSTVTSNSAAMAGNLNPNLQYLRATVRGKSALLVLGYVEPHPLGPIQVWYSAEREVLRLQNGRLVGAVGMISEWRNVVLTRPPEWSSITRTGGPVHFVRVRDVMPGYRYGVKELVTVRPAATPSRNALLELDPSSLSWFEESAVAATGMPAISKGEVLPLARYAVTKVGNDESVVYGEQCLSPEFCFTWQRWPALRPDQKASR